MKRFETASRRLVQAALISLACAGTAQAQSLDEQKKQLEIEQLELNEQKTVNDMVASSRTTTAGSATLTAIDQSAEGLMLSRQAQKRTARDIAARLGTNVGPISVVFGDQPASTADYLAVEHGVAALRANLARANAMAREYYKKPEASRGQGPRGSQYFEMMVAPGALPLALTAVTTVASLLRVNTTIAGAALAIPNEQYKAILMQELKRYHWTVDPPRKIVSATEYADALLGNMAAEKDEAATYYLKYVGHLAQKDGKPANLPEGEVIVGKALETALNDHATLTKALFTPINGVLPATVIEEQKLLALGAADRRILYILHHRAALTSITKQGPFTGIFSVPAYVSASHVVEFALRSPVAAEELYDTVRYDTPVMRVTSVRKWLAAEQQSEAKVASHAAGLGAAGR